MNTYLFPLCDVNEDISWIEKIKARSLSHAEDKLVQMLLDDYEDLDLPDDLSEMRRILSSKGIVLGELYDIEEF